MTPISLAIGLFFTGLLLITVCISALRKPKADPYVQANICEAPSPDDSLRCTQEIGHFGWHTSSGASWFGSAWECDQWADTEQATIVEMEPTLAAEHWPKPDPYPDIIGPAPLKFKIGAFGTRRPITD